jgi:hypothetical protein
MLSSILLLVLLIILFLLTVNRKIKVKESLSFAGISCPRPGKKGYIDCNSIEIENIEVREKTCDALRQHCKVIADNEKPSS